MALSENIGVKVQMIWNMVIVNSVKLSGDADGPLHYDNVLFSSAKQDVNSLVVSFAYLLPAKKTRLWLLF